ncbi:hypothetical protein BIT35_04775 [Klebsiella pneumoniae]|nr:hypothetical protein BIT35_04775 [Klebsiella pneumoniae]
MLFGIPSSAIIVAALQGPMRPIKLRISIARVSAGTSLIPTYWTPILNTGISVAIVRAVKCERHRGQSFSRILDRSQQKIAT